jgi:hypothetical protein
LELVWNLPDAPEVALVWHYHPRLPLDGLHHEGGRVRILEYRIVITEQP